MRHAPNPANNQTKTDWNVEIQFDFGESGPKTFQCDDEVACGQACHVAAFRIRNGRSQS